MRAADAAKNTANLIDNTVKKIRHGSEIVEKTNDAFLKVADGADRVSNLLGKIAVATQEQSLGIEQINIAMSSMDKIVEHSAANAQESASASMEMEAQAKQLNWFVSELTTLVNGYVSGQDNPGEVEKDFPLAGRAIQPHTSAAGDRLHQTNTENTFSVKNGHNREITYNGRRIN
jgi:methyl-accepting chemotaxis protein